MGVANKLSLTFRGKMDLYFQLQNLINQLQKCVESIRPNTLELAQADMEYKIALRQELLRLEAEGRPVTNLLYIARGKENVAKAKYRQIAAENILKANYEAINSVKLQIRILQAQIDKEQANPLWVNLLFKAKKSVSYVEQH